MIAHPEPVSKILGPEYGLPRGIAVSGHNQFWFWGIPAGRGDPSIVVSDPGENCGGGHCSAQTGRLPSGFSRGEICLAVCRSLRRLWLHEAPCARQSTNLG